MVSEVSKVNKKASHASRSLDQYYQRVTVLLTSKINNKTKKELTEYGDKCFILSHHTVKSTRRERLNSSQGDINCRPSSQSYFIKNYFLSNFLIEFSISSHSGCPDGKINVTVTPFMDFFLLEGHP